MATQGRNCELCQQRSDWDFLRDFFHREQSLIQRQEELYAQHVKERQDLQSSLAAVRLSYYSSQAHLATAEDRSNELKKTNADLMCQRDALREQLNLLDGILRESQKFQLQAENTAIELQQSSVASQAVIERQEHDFKEQAAELKAAEAAARELGDMMNEVVSANDFGAAAFNGAVRVADLVMRNKYLEGELESQLERTTRSAVTDMLPTSTSSETLYSVPSNDEPYVPLLTLPTEEEHCPQLADTVDAREQWETYRDMHPLLENDLP